MAASTIHTGFYLSGRTAALTDLMPRDEAVRNARAGVCVVLVDRGEARIEIDARGYLLEPGCVVVLLPFHTMALRMQSADFQFEYLYFDFDFMADFPLLLPPEESEHFAAAPCSQVDEAAFLALTRSYDTMQMYSLMQEHPYRIGVVKAQLYTFIAELLFRVAHRAAGVRTCRGEELTDDFFGLLHRHHSTERSLAFYADQLCVTTKHLSKVIRRTTAHTVYFWIEEFTIKQAKQLLRSTPATVTEIAEQLHFPNSSFFAKFFRRHVGCSPVAFRRDRLT